MIALDILYGYMVYYVLATIGISIGYHAYFSHREFKSSPWMECIMLICGLICGGKSVLNWCVAHRMHHLYADTEKDPHSPKHKGLSVLFSLTKPICKSDKISICLKFSEIFSLRLLISSRIFCLLNFIRFF